MTLEINCLRTPKISIKFDIPEHPQALQHLKHWGCVVESTCSKPSCPNFKKTTSLWCKPSNKPLTAAPRTSLLCSLVGDKALKGNIFQYFSTFQIPAMEQGIGSVFSLHRHRQLVCALFPSPAWLWASGSDYSPLCLCFWSLATIQFTWQLATCLPLCWIVSVSFWHWLLACRIALIKKLMKGNANDCFACVLSQSSFSPSLFPREGKNEALGFCCFL